MKTLTLKVNDDYYDELLTLLPKNKVSVVDDNFLRHQKLLQYELDSYLNEETAYTLYKSSIDKTNKWIEK